MENLLTPALPVRPPAGYVGGKRHLARTIIERIRQVPHTTYVEPFVGMGGVFLRRPFRAKGEVINDLSRDVTTLFRVLQRHYVPLMDMLRWQITSRAEFQRLLAAAPDTLTDLERAVRCLYLQRLAFGGKVTGRSFGVDGRGPARFDVTKLGPHLDELHDRLAGVVIECLPFGRLIEAYDHPGTLFYLDPPYWGSEHYYGRDAFAREDFERLAAQLGGIKGRFLLSLNDVPGVRETFARFQIEAVATLYHVGGGASTQGKAVGEAGELLISGGRCM